MSPRASAERAPRAERESRFRDTLPKGRFDVVRRKVWHDKRVRSLSNAPPNGQTLFFRLLTGPEKGVLPGVICIGEAALAEQLGWSVEGAADGGAAWVARHGGSWPAAFLASMRSRSWQGFPLGLRDVMPEAVAQFGLRHDWAAGVVFLPNGIRHAPPDNPNVVRGWRLAWEELPECDLKDEIAVHFRAFLSQLGRAYFEAFEEVTKCHTDPFGNPFGNPFPNPLATQEQEQEQYQEQNPPPRGRVREATAHPWETRLPTEAPAASETRLRAAPRHGPAEAAAPAELDDPPPSSERPSGWWPSAPAPAAEPPQAPTSGRDRPEEAPVEPPPDDESTEQSGRVLGATRRVRDRGTRRFESDYLVAAYERAAGAALGHSFAVPHEERPVLDDVVDKHCPAAELRGREDWLARTVAAFVPCVDDDARRFRGGTGPRGLLRWLNDGRPKSSPPRPQAYGGVKRIVQSDAAWGGKRLWKVPEGWT